MSDEIRSASKETIETLKSLGISIVMITGDNEFVAKKIADALGIEEYYYGLTPVEKVKRIRKLKKQYQSKTVVFVGDGINDAPVLKNADVGIAMGEFGSDAAIEVSDIVLMHDDLSKLPTIFNISKKTRKIVIENIVFALTVKIAVLILAIFDKSGYIRMWEGVFADVGVSLIATINALRAVFDGKTLKRIIKSRGIK